MLFGSGSSNTKKGEQRRQTSSYSSGQHHSNTAEDDYISVNRKKIFTKDEGEYVDFEEVK